MAGIDRRHEAECASETRILDRAASHLAPAAKPATGTVAVPMTGQVTPPAAPAIIAMT